MLCHVVAGHNSGEVVKSFHRFGKAETVELEGKNIMSKNLYSFLIYVEPLF